MRRLSLALAAAASIAFATPAWAGPSEDFHALMDQYWAAQLRNSPTFASSVGVNTYDAQLDVLSLQEMDRQAAEAAAFLARLNAIAPSALTPADQTNYLILKRTLETGVEANRFGERQMLYSTLGSYHGFLSGMAESQPFRTLADYENYLKRIALVPDRMRSYGDISVKAAREGYTQPCVTLTNFTPTIRGDIAADPTQSRYYLPFAGQKPASVSDAQWADLKARAAALIRDRINPSYEGFAKLYETQLASKCRKTVGASSLPQGKDYYAYLVRSTRPRTALRRRSTSSG